MKILLLLLAALVVASDRLDADIDALRREATGSLSSLGSLRQDPQQQQADVCTGGKKVADNLAYLEAFHRGPCSPVIVLAGMAGTKLRVVIDCPKLRANHRDIFDTCGWSSCERSWSDVFGKAPREEYTVWIPDAISPFSLLSPTARTKACLAAVLGIRYEQASGEVRQQAVTGVSISSVGFTPETRKNSRCGFDSISNLVPLSASVLPTKFRQFDKLRESLEKMGYRVGLTLQALPYDWRLSMHDNGLPQKLPKLLERMASLTGKKVSLMAHSFGNINLLNVFAQMSPEAKEATVLRHFALAPPFLGSPTTLFMLLGGSSKYSYAGLGIDFATFKKTLANFPSVFNLLPRKSLLLFRDAPWLHSVLNRISRENGQPQEFSLRPEDDVVLATLPSHEEECFDGQFRDRTRRCASGMTRFDHFGKVGDTDIAVDRIAEVLREFSYEQNAARLYEQELARSDYDQLRNSGVQTVIVYSGIAQTPHSYEYILDPKMWAANPNADFVEPDLVQTSYGDNAVLASSSLVPGFKWAWEHSKGLPGAKPVIFAEVCSRKKRRDSVYQSAEGRVVKSEYQGVPCTCKPGSEDGCGHLGLVADAGVVGYLTASLLDRQTPQPLPALEQRALDELVSECGLVNGL